MRCNFGGPLVISDRSFSQRNFSRTNIANIFAHPIKITNSRNLASRPFLPPYRMRDRRFLCELFTVFVVEKMWQSNQKFFARTTRKTRLEF